MTTEKQEWRVVSKMRRRGRRNCRAGVHDYVRRGNIITAIDREAGVVTLAPDENSPLGCAWCGLLDVEYA